MAFFHGLLEHLTTALQELALQEEGLLCKLGLVLQVYLVPGLMVSYCVLQDHDVKCPYYGLIGEFTLV